MKIILYIVIALFVFLGIKIIFDAPDSFTESGIQTVGTGQDIEKLSMAAITQGNISICKNFKIAAINIPQYGENEILNRCEESYNKATEDKTNENISFRAYTLVSGAGTSYSLPKNWGSYVNRNDYSCLNVYKPYPLYKEDNLFLLICAKSEKSVEDYISKTSIKGIERNVVSGSTTVKIFDLSNGDKQYVTIKDGKLYDFQYTYKPLVYSDFDEKRILEIINRIEVKK